MQQFVVPQFIDVEDKIFGPITTRQFLILLVAGIIIFAAYKFADFSLFITVAVVIGGLALVISFLRVNGQTFHYFVLNILQTVRKPSLRIWRKDFSNEELNFWRKLETVQVEKTEQKEQAGPKRIRDLALIVNTGGFYKPED